MASPPTYGAPGSGLAESKVSTPAIAILVVAGLGIAACVLGLLLNVLGMGASTLGGMGGDERLRGMLSGTVGLVSNVLGLGVYGLAVFGALKMKALENHTMAVAGAVCVMLPCSCCCFVGLPVGIWGLVVLLNAEVKAAFRS